MGFDRARAVADAVLFEGYALYPYRPSSIKNRLRFQFGVVAPRAWSEAGGEPWWTEAQCLVETEPRARLEGRLRFLRLRRRRIEDAAGREVESLDAGDRLHVAWDEGEPCEIDFALPLDAGELSLPIALPADADRAPILDGGGAIAGRVLRDRAPLEGRLRAMVEPLSLERPAARLRLRFENRTPFGGGDRDAALASSAIGVHLLLQIANGNFVSLLDPPAWAAEAASRCRGVGLWPVLVGEPGARDLLLAAPIILYDHPQIAAESPGDLFDATEIDEILTLRTRTLTDGEKREARAADPRVAALIDRADGLPGPVLAGLHGAFRDAAGRQECASVRLGEATIERGSRLVLRPGARRSDAQDLLLAGRSATVRAILHDLDGAVHLAVTVDDDPGAELHAAFGRYHYFRLDEVEPLPVRP